MHRTNNNRTTDRQLTGALIMALELKGHLGDLTIAILSRPRGIILLSFF